MKSQSTGDTEENQHWNTPSWILDGIRNLDVIYLDPCSNKHSITSASFQFTGCTESDDGLKQDWTAICRTRGLTYVNPPYSRGKIELWLEKCRVEGLKGCEIIALVPARTSAKWFKSTCFPGIDSDGICWLGRRVKFIGAKSSPAWESVLVYWGAHAKRFEEVLSPLGVCWV